MPQKKKKLSKFPQNGQKPVFLKIQNLICGRNCPEIGLYVSGRSVQFQTLPQFFLLQSDKNSLRYLKNHTPPQKKGRFGGMIIKCRLQRISLNMALMVIPDLLLVFPNLLHGLVIQNNLLHEINEDICFDQFYH